ncbi:hypothetical protein F5Y01DRAFT_284254 [Xylaria sp. FL0043]|nr:hypothetical protein F5Y01DRAFT_284254 [Xylaria sp. FL0043]
MGYPPKLYGIKCTRYSENNAERDTTTTPIQSLPPVVQRAVRAGKREIQQNTEAKKSGCPFSFSVVKIQIGTDRWEINYPQKKSQHIHNHGPRDGPVTRPRRGEQTLQNEDKGLARLDPISL